MWNVSIYRLHDFKQEDAMQLYSSLQEHPFTIYSSFIAQIFQRLFQTFFSKMKLIKPDISPSLLLFLYL